MKNEWNWKKICMGMIILQSMLYGSLDAILKIVYQTVPTCSFLLLRYSFATLFIFLVWHKPILQDLRNVSAKHYIIPCLCLGAAFVLSNVALEKTAATNVAFLRSLSGLMVPVVLLLFYQKPYTLKTVVLQGIMLLGLYLLCTKGNLAPFGWGEILAFSAAALVAGSLVFGGQALHYVNAITLSCVQSACSMVMCSLWGTGSEILFRTDWQNFFVPQTVLVLIYAALGCTVGGYLLQNIALQHTSSRQVGMMQCTYPVATAFFAFLILHEQLSFWGFVGAGLILLCILLESAQKAAAS